MRGCIEVGPELGAAIHLDGLFAEALERLGEERLGG